MSEINFFSEKIDFELDNAELVKEWISDIVNTEEKKITNLNFIFCPDQYLHHINLTYLNHDNYTDIVTFDNSDHPGEIEGDIYISIDRVRKNSKDYKKRFQDELYRVIIHGVLHLIGYKDKTPEEKMEMRKKEDSSLSLQKF